MTAAEAYVFSADDGVTLSAYKITTTGQLTETRERRKINKQRPGPYGTNLSAFSVYFCLREPNTRMAPRGRVSSW